VQEPTVECWSPARGIPLELQEQEEKTSTTLAVARIASWRLTTFVEGLGELMGEAGDFEEVKTEDVDLGGEVVTDVFIRFGSEGAAEGAKEVLHGKMLNGRKLQVKYA
jgi:hypothetical protein